MPRNTPRSPRLLKRDLSTLCEHILKDHLRQADEMRNLLLVPKLRDHVMEHAGLHFHFNPDFVIGIKGASCFEFIQEKFVVEAGGIAIIPGGIPHREVVLEREAPFENLVISVYNETVSVQLQGSAGEGKARRLFVRRVDHRTTPTVLETVEPGQCFFEHPWAAGVPGEGRAHICAQPLSKRSIVLGSGAGDSERHVRQGGNTVFVLRHTNELPAWIVCGDAAIPSPDSRRTKVEQTRIV